MKPNSSEYFIYSIKNPDEYIILLEFRFHFYRYARMFNLYVYSTTMETRQLTYSPFSYLAAEIKFTEIASYVSLQLSQYTKYLIFTLKGLSSIFHSSSAISNSSFFLPKSHKFVKIDRLFTNFSTPDKEDQNFILKLSWDNRTI
jgi:hypothetical protein